MKFYLSLFSVGEGDVDLDALLRTSPRLPSPSVAASTEHAALQSYGQYFSNTWLAGHNGSTPAGWAMCYRTIETHGLVRSTNNLAENGNWKMAHSLVESGVNSQNHAEFMQWFLRWASESGALIALLPVANPD